MKREFLINILFLLLINLLIKPFYVFGIERTIQDRVGAEEYGLYATLFSFAYLFFILNDLGLQQFNNRTISRHPGLIERYFPRLFTVKLLLGGMYLAVVFIAAWLRGFESAVFGLLFFISLNHLLISMVGYLRSNLQGLGRYRTDSAVSVLDKLLLTLICAWLLWGPPGANPFQISWFVHAQNVSWLLTALLALALLLRHRQGLLHMRFRLLFAWAVMRQALPFALAIFLMTAYTRLDMVILEWMLPDGRHETGIYAAAFRLFEAFSAVGLMFAGLLLPMYAKLLRKRELESPGIGQTGAGMELSSLVKMALQLIWAGTIPLALSCFFFREPLMHLLYPATGTPYYGEVLAFLILTLIPFSGMYIVSTLLTANASLRKMNWLFAIGILLNVGLNILLIPTHKAVGAGLATLATQSLVFGGLLWIVSRTLHLPKPAGGWGALRALLFAGLTALAAWQWQHYEGIPWLWRFLLAFATGLLIAAAMRMVHLKALTASLRNG